jgi:hypothetical protein
MPRSPIPRIQQRAKEIVEELNADNLLMAEVLDALVPLPESEVPVKKTRKKRAKAAKSNRASGMAAAIQQSLDASRQAASNRTDEDSAACAECPNGPDHNIHHKRSEEGFHEFKEAA